MLNLHQRSGRRRARAACSRCRCSPTAYASRSHPSTSASTSAALIRRKVVHVVARRNRLDPPKAWMLQPPREDDMTVHPLCARCDLRERHARLKGDSRLLRKHLNRPTSLDCSDDRVKQLTDRRRFVAEMMLQVQLPARMRLVPIRERSAAPCARPERAFRPRSHTNLDRQPPTSAPTYFGNRRIMFPAGISRLRCSGFARRVQPLSSPRQRPRSSNDSCTYGIPSAPSGVVPSAR